MSNLSKAADDLKNFANKFKAILEVSAALEEIGSIEQAKRDADIAKEQAYKAVSDVKAKHVEALAHLEKIKGDIDTAKGTHVKVEDWSKAKAIEIVGDANKTAAKIIQDAEYKKTQFDKFVADKNDELNQINSDIASKQSEFNEITKQIKDVKAKLAHFVG